MATPRLVTVVGVCVELVMPYRRRGTTELIGARASRRSGVAQGAGERVQGGLAEQAEPDQLDVLEPVLHRADAGEGHGRGVVDRIAVDACRDRREGDGPAAERVGHLERAA